MELSGNKLQAFSTANFSSPTRSFEIYFFKSILFPNQVRNCQQKAKLFLLGQTSNNYPEMIWIGLALFQTPSTPLKPLFFLFILPAFSLFALFGMEGSQLDKRGA